MKIKFYNALYIALSAATINASAQKTYTKGVITYQTEVQGQAVEMKEYFTADSTATILIAGPATISMLSDANYQSFVTLVDIPVASIKKAAVYTPDEIKEAMAALPAFTYAPGNEAKQISGFNCTKVVITNTKDNMNYDIWITNDISVPANAVPPYYKDIGGFPVQYATFQQGKVATVTVTKVSEDVPLPGTFSIPPDFDKISKADMEAMSHGN